MIIIIQLSSGRNDLWNALMDTGERMKKGITMNERTGMINNLRINKSEKKKEFHKAPTNLDYKTSNS